LDYPRTHFAPVEAYPDVERLRGDDELVYGEGMYIDTSP
jgi:hypothetical protein